MISAPHMLCAYCKSTHGLFNNSQKLETQMIHPLTGIGNRMLHPCVGHDDEDSPTAMSRRILRKQQTNVPSYSGVFPKQKKTEECRFEEEGKCTFHRERLADDSSGQPRELRPIRAELKFHWNSGDHPENEIDAEDAGPEARGMSIFRFRYGDRALRIQQ